MVVLIFATIRSSLSLEISSTFPGGGGGGEEGWSLREVIKI